MPTWILVYYYTINGYCNAFYWKGDLPEDFNSSDTIGTYVPRLSQYDTIVVWVSMPNGVVDTTTTDDTLSIITYGCESFFQGDYVIGPNSGADFANVSSFLQALSLCGSAGNVTLHVQNGVYNENWDFSNLNDIMGMYTLRIKSQSGKRDSVILQPTGGVGIVLNNTNHLVIEDITINALTKYD